MLKQCSECHKKKSLRFFYRDIQKSDGLTSNCRDCKRKRHLEYYEKSKEKRKEYSKRFYSKYNERIKELNKDRYRKVMIELFDLLGNKCSICEEKDKRVLGVDHINGGGHRERMIKGSSYTYYQAMIDSVKNKEGKYQLLCANCNLKEAFNKGYKKTIWTSKQQLKKQ